MVDRDLVVRKMALILDDLRAAAPIAEKSLDEFLGSRLDEVVTERDLERMIGRMIDIDYQIDPRRVHEGLVAAVRDIPEYQPRIHDYLEGGPPPPHG